MSIFNNKSILAWLQYFSENTDSLCPKISQSSSEKWGAKGANRRTRSSVHSFRNFSLLFSSDSYFTSALTYSISLATEVLKEKASRSREMFFAA